MAEEEVSVATVDGASLVEYETNEDENPSHFTQDDSSDMPEWSGEEGGPSHFFSHGSQEVIQEEAEESTPATEQPSSWNQDELEQWAHTEDHKPSPPTITFGKVKVHEAPSSNYSNPRLSSPSSPSSRAPGSQSPKALRARKKKVVRKVSKKSRADSPPTTSPARSRISKSGDELLDDNIAMLMAEQVSTKPNTVIESPSPRAGSIKSMLQQAKAIHRLEPTSEDSDADDFSDEGEENLDLLSSEYQHVLRLCKYIREGNRSTTIIAICSLQDVDLRYNLKNQLALIKVGGIELLLSMLAADTRIKIGCLSILKDACANRRIAAAVGTGRGIQKLCEQFNDPDVNLRCLVCDVMSHVAVLAKNRIQIRRLGGVMHMMKLIGTKKIDPVLLRKCTAALRVCCRNNKIKQMVRANGLISLIAKQLEDNSVKDEELLVIMIGLLEELSRDPACRAEVRQCGVVQTLIRLLKSTSLEALTVVAEAIHQCVQDKDTQELYRKSNGIQPLLDLLERSEKRLLIAASAAVWKLAGNVNSVKALQKLNVVDRMVRLLQNPTDMVKVNAAGALWNCALHSDDSRRSMQQAGAIPILVDLLKQTSEALLINTAGCLWACALHDLSIRAVVAQHDGIRLLWSLMKIPSARVQANAAGALCPVVDSPDNLQIVVDSLMGGLELLVYLLGSKDEEVQANVCAAVGNISKAEATIAVMTEEGLLPRLARLTNTRKPNVQKHLAYAIAQCCSYGVNRKTFGKLNGVVPLVDFLRSSDPAVLRSTAVAMLQLSDDPDNAAALRTARAVPLLVELMGSDDEILQDAAAGSVSNIRRWYMKEMA
eukprot:GILK01004630.1.p1 GENE.GILK01004630.1~~GILK01004630.1.p1  ORF type:complete len:826 (-),score=172.80 GILK01004630.1:480-2957(-)